MIKRIIDTEENTMTFKELENIIKKNYLTVVRSALEVFKPYEDATYKIIKDANYYHLLNVNTLAITYTSHINSTLPYFIKALIADNYIVKIHTDNLNKDEED